MAEKQKNADADTSAQASEVGADQVTEAADQDRERGYRGEVPPGPANEEYSLESGPESPGPLNPDGTPVEPDKDQP